MFSVVFLLLSLLLLLPSAALLGGHRLVADNQHLVSPSLCPVLNVGAPPSQPLTGKQFSGCFDSKPFGSLKSLPPPHMPSYLEALLLVFDAIINETFS